MDCRDGEDGIAEAKEVVSPFFEGVVIDFVRGDDDFFAVAMEAFGYFDIEGEHALGGVDDEDVDAGLVEGFFDLAMGAGGNGIAGRFTVEDADSGHIHDLEAFAVEGGVGDEAVAGGAAFFVNDGDTSFEDSVEEG